MAKGFLGRKLEWIAVCTLAGFVAAFAYVEGHVVKQAITVVSSTGQLAEPFILLTVFWTAILILLLGTVRLFRN